MCWNSLVIRESDDNMIGFCDKCRIVRVLSTIEKHNYTNNEQCKTQCTCGHTAYVHSGSDSYECMSCHRKIPLLDHTRTYLEIKNKNKQIMVQESEPEPDPHETNLVPKTVKVTESKNEKNHTMILVNENNHIMLSVIQEPECDDMIYIGRNKMFIQRGRFIQH